MKVELKYMPDAKQHLILIDDKPAGLINKFSFKYDVDDGSKGLWPTVELNFVPSELIIDGAEVFHIDRLKS